nr:uncharacterized protein LOC127331849 [Lolium perenne]
MVAESQDKALELFATKTVDAHFQLDLNRCSSPVDARSPPPMNQEEATESPIIQEAPLEKEYDDHDDGDNDVKMNYNNVGDLDAYLTQEDMDHSIPYSRYYASYSDDDGPDEQVDEDGLMANEAERADIFKKVTRQDIRIPLFQDVSLADGVVVDGGKSLVLGARPISKRDVDARTNVIVKGLTFDTFLELKVEGAPPRVPSDVNMSEAPGESGDDDPQANGQEKKAESDRNAKRTKNVEEKDGAQGGDMSAPKSSTTAAGLNVMNCISPHVASEVADVVGECMPTPDAVHSPGVQVDWTKNGDGDIGCELPGRTSLLYGDAVSRHAGKCLDVPAVQVLQASVPVPSPIGSPARLEGGPGVGRPGTSSRPVCGPGTERPNLHGTPAPMRCTPRIATSIAEAQVIASPILDGSNMNLNIQNFDKNNGVQGGLTVGGTPRDMHKGLPRTSPYTQEQIIAFGGIKEEKMRGVRSSGRLRAQPNSDVPLLERAMMLAEKRAEMPAIVLYLWEFRWDNLILSVLKRLHY